jgi:hypothetical protein
MDFDGEQGHLDEMEPQRNAKSEAARGRGVGGGRARMAELAAQAEAERQAEGIKLLAELGRQPTASETLLVEQASALAVRARRLRSQGRDAEAEDVSRLLIRALTKLGLKMGAAFKPPYVPLRTRLLAQLEAERAAKTAAEQAKDE